MPHSNPLTGEAADRQALRELVDAWARCADRRLSQQQAELFTPDGTVTVYLGDPATTEPVQRLQGHTQPAEAFKVLDTYKATTHFNRQSTVTFDVDNPDTAVGETYCLAHHVWMENGQRTLMVMSIRYLDTFARNDGGWLFAARQLVTDWTDKRPSTDD
jgi:SnoaL-like domain